MIDLNKAKSAFKHYISQFDLADDKINRKIIHTYKVVECAKHIAENLKLSQEDIELAQLIGLLHDIGRFEQAKRFDDFRDAYTIDHAELGVQILFKENLIRNFIQEAQYDEMIKKSMTAYCYDTPESTIYINHYMIKAIYNIQNNCYDYYVKPHIKYKNYSNVDTKEIENNLEEIEQVTKEFVMTLSGTDAEKLTQIHNWLIDGARYDMTLSLPNTANIYGAIIDKSCICAGFANAFKYVADMADLKVIYVTGTAFFSGTTAYHAWNLANVEGKWKIVDVTWDLSCSNEYEFSKRFLLIFRDEENGTAHIPETEKFVYPD